MHRMTTKTSTRCLPRHRHYWLHRCWEHRSHHYPNRHQGCVHRRHCSRLRRSIRRLRSSRGTSNALSLLADTQRAFQCTRDLPCKAFLPHRCLCHRTVARRHHIRVARRTSSSLRILAFHRTIVCLLLPAPLCHRTDLLSLRGYLHQKVVPHSATGTASDQPRRCCCLPLKLRGELMGA